MDVVNAENAGAIFRKEKYPKQIRPMPLGSLGTSLCLALRAASPCKSAILPISTAILSFDGRDSLSLRQRAASLPHPFGQLPPKLPVLGAA